MNARRTHGFTLIELMIVVAVIATIASIAYPAYISQMEKVRRADATGALTGLAQAMERWFTENNTYAVTPGSTTPPTLGDGGIFADQAPLDSSRKSYDLSVQSVSDIAYVLRATPIASGPQKTNGFLQLSSTGVRAWDRDNNGSIAGDGSESCWRDSC